MTSAATIAGHFPLVLASGPGAGARNSIGVVLVSGMVIGTIFTLFVLPAVYLLIAGDHRPNPGEDSPKADGSDLPLEPVEALVR